VGIVKLLDVLEPIHRHVVVDAGGRLPAVPDPVDRVDGELCDAAVLVARHRFF
jgi:hypothetical protein